MPIFAPTVLIAVLRDFCDVVGDSSARHVKALTKQWNVQLAEVPIQLNSLFAFHAIQVYQFGSFQAKDDGRPAQLPFLPLLLSPAHELYAGMQTCHFPRTQFGSAADI